MKLRVFALLAASLAAAACTDSPSEPVVGFDGALSFTYTGGGGGTFSADGDFSATSSTTQYAEDWAWGFQSSAEVLVGVIANQPRSATTHDMLIIGVNRETTGSSAISAECDVESEEACTGVVFYRGQSNSFGTYEQFCVLSNGSVDVTTISGGRLKGTFSGGGFCFDSDANEDQFVVTNGSFDVPLLTDPTG